MWGKKIRSFPCLPSYVAQVDDSDGERALSSQAVGGEPLEHSKGAHDNSRQVSYNDSGLTVVTIEAQDESVEDGMLFVSYYSFSEPFQPHRKSLFAESFILIYHKNPVLMFTHVPLTN